ncbi:MAG: hypothetical protein GY847_25485 [Proteobacteria bacterium]|nr:hypothetical protein [Pseudomonadota bacterium]
MTEKEKASSAILAVFPTLTSLENFIESEENKSTLESFIAYATEKHVITTSNKETFSEFIDSNCLELSDCTPPENLTLEELFEKKEDYLNIGFSARGLTDRINALVNKNQIELPKVSNTMLTRLKKEPADTPHKLNTLRSLAFWLGHERSNLGPSWNFETLRKLCNKSDQPVDYKEGVRIAFSLYSRGDVIGNEIVDWLKRELKEYIKHNVVLLPYGGWGKVKFHDITTLYVDFPKERGGNNPAASLQCIRDAISIAHQIAIRWALSDYCTNKRFLAIGIAVGEFSGLDNYLLPVLNVKLPDDPVIRLTDYARQCVLINGIRTVFCDEPKEVVMFNGEPLNIWWVVGLWSTFYWDFVPGLKNAEILQNNPTSSETLREMLLFPGIDTTPSENENVSNEITTFFRFPHNSLLGIEIAKTLYYRKKFWEADEILRILLSINPTNLNARSLRMSIYRNMGTEVSSYSSAELLFMRAEEEAEYIGKVADEDFYDEYAVVKLAKALIILRTIRQTQGVFKSLNICLTKEEVYKLLDETESLLIRGITVSPNRARSIYLWGCTRALKMTLKNDEGIFLSPDKPLNCPKHIIEQFVIDAGIAMGWLKEESSENVLLNIVKTVYLNLFNNHYEFVSLDAYRPTIHFCLAVGLWDFYLTRDADVAKATIKLLEDAIEIARELETEDICIYSYTRLLGEMMPAKQFISHMKKAIQMVDTWTEDSEHRDFLLLTLNI